MAGVHPTLSSPYVGPYRVIRGRDSRHLQNQTGLGISRRRRRSRTPRQRNRRRRRIASSPEASDEALQHAPPPPPRAPGMPPMPPGAPNRPLDNFKPVMKLKNIPQPQNPLKSFNWAKLADNKLSGTLWTNLDDTKLYSRLDLAEIGEG